MSNNEGPFKEEIGKKYEASVSSKQMSGSSSSANEGGQSEELTTTSKQESQDEKYQELVELLAVGGIPTSAPSSSSPELAPTTTAEQQQQQLRNVIRRRRFALNCTNCRRRKVKCDRTIPCSQCRRRGEANTCTIEDIDRPYDRGYDLPPSISRRHSTINVNLSSTISIEEKIRSIRRELAHLEAISQDPSQDNSSSSGDNLSPSSTMAKSPFEEVPAFILDQQERTIVDQEDEAIDRLEKYAWTGERRQSEESEESEENRSKPVYWSEWAGMHTLKDDEQEQDSQRQNQFKSIADRTATSAQRKFQLMKFLPPPPIIECLLEIFQERVALLTGNVVQINKLQMDFQKMCLKLQRDPQDVSTIPADLIALLFSISLLAITYPPNHFSERRNWQIIQPYIHPITVQDWYFAVQEALELQGGPLLLQSRQAIQASHLLDFFESNPEKRDARLHIELAAAQRIGLHRLKTTNESQKVEGQYDKRLWWALVVRDWGDSLGRQSFSVLPKMINVGLPEEIEKSSVEHIYLNANIALASIVRDHCQAIMNAQEDGNGKAVKFTLTDRKMLDLRYLGILAGLSDSLERRARVASSELQAVEKVDEFTFKLVLQQNVFQKRLLLHREALNLQSNLRFSQVELAVMILKTVQEVQSQETVMEISFRNNQAHLFLSALIALVHLIVNHDLLRNGKKVSITIERERVRSLANVAIVPPAYLFSQNDQAIFRIQKLLIGLLRLEAELYDNMIRSKTTGGGAGKQVQEDLPNMISRLIGDVKEQQKQQQDPTVMERMHSSDSLDRIVSTVMTSLPSMVVPSQSVVPMEMTNFPTNQATGMPTAVNAMQSNLEQFTTTNDPLVNLQSIAGWRQMESNDQAPEEETRMQIERTPSAPGSIIDPRTASQAQFWDWLMSQNFE